MAKMAVPLSNPESRIQDLLSGLGLDLDFATCYMYIIATAHVHVNVNVKRFTGTGTGYFTVSSRSSLASCCSVIVMCCVEIRAILYRKA